MERAAGGATALLLGSALVLDLGRDFGAALRARFAFKSLDLGRAALRPATFFADLVFALVFVAMTLGSSAKSAELIKVVALKVK